MNNDLISREGLKEVFNGYHSGIGSQPKFTLGACLQLIDNAPTVGALDTDDEPKTSRQERALEIIDALKDDRLIGNKQRGTLRRAILDNTPEVPSNMTLIPTAVLDDLTKTTRELGEWKIDGALIACDVCGQILLKASKLYKYCPNCGALMVNNGGD